jgi:hypothetical protein
VNPMDAAAFVVDEVNASYALKEFADGKMVGRIEGRPLTSDFFSAVEERLVGQHVITISCQK